MKTFPRKFIALIALGLLLISITACMAGGLLATQAVSTVAALPTAAIEFTQPAPEETAAAAFTPDATLAPTPVPPTETPAPAPTDAPIRFGVIGDYGEGNQAEADVANLVKSWNPDFIITVGDNNYPEGAAETIDQNIGQFYHQFIYPYNGAFGQGADKIRFFPTLGNHDWDTQHAKPYFDYFKLPGNQRYYDFVWGPVHFFAVDADSREPDGVGASSVQAQWLKAKLAESQSVWNVVYFHQPAFSSGIHGSTDWMDWPFKKWGASVVMSGHDHTYERLNIDGLTYFVNGLGGGPIYSFESVLPGSRMRFNNDYGAMLVTADDQRMSFQFITRKGDVIDTYQMNTSGAQSSVETALLAQIAQK